MNKILLIFTLLAATAAWGTDCGIKPKGMEFGPNCELIRLPAPPPKKVMRGSPLEAPATPPIKKKNWQTILFGAYVGKPGFYAMIGTAQDLKVDALLMNEDVTEKAQNATHDLKLGGVVACEAVGLQQPLGYTLFDLRNCSGKN